MKNWIFDLDGTLVDSFSHYFRSLESIFEEHGKVFSDDLKHSALTDHLRDFFARHLGTDRVEPAFERLQVVSNADAEKIKPFGGMIEILEHLKSRGSRIAIWTNRDHESASLIVKHAGLGSYVDAFVSGTCVSLRKPHPEGLLRIVDQFGCDISQVAMVGDHEYDVSSARDVGAHAVRASWHSYWDVDPCTHAHDQFFDVTSFANWVRERV